MIRNENYCHQKGLYSKADAVKTELNNIINDYKITTLGTQYNSVHEGGEIGLKHLF